jgi:hypothetical protein
MALDSVEAWAEEVVVESAAAVLESASVLESALVLESVSALALDSAAWLKKEKPSSPHTRTGRVLASNTATIA